MTENWLDIYSEYNKENKQLEILAVGEIDGNAYRTVKAISEEELKSFM